jgi:hypothetical protein
VPSRTSSSPPRVSSPRVRRWHTVLALRQTQRASRRAGAPWSRPGGGLSANERNSRERSRPLLKKSHAGWVRPGARVCVEPARSSRCGCQAWRPSCHHWNSAARVHLQRQRNFFLLSSLLPVEVNSYRSTQTWRQQVPGLAVASQLKRHGLQAP